MSTQHTPGPWLTDASGLGKPDVRAASGRAIACTWMVCSSTPKSAKGYQARANEDRANARLIAAAPELLDALRQWAWAEENNDAAELANARFSRDTAIAKATGEAP